MMKLKQILNINFSTSKRFHNFQLHHDGTKIHYVLFVAIIYLAFNFYLFIILSSPVQDFIITITITLKIYKKVGNIFNTLNI